jgi:adenosine deaminase
VDYIVQIKYPLIDLHRHLEGCVRPETIIDLASQHGLSLPAWTAGELLPYLQVGGPVAGIMSYIARFELFQYSMVDYAAVRRITFECIEDAHLEGIHYLELRFSPVFMAEKHDLDPAEVVAAVCDGLADASQALPIRAKLIGIMSRTYGTDSCWRELEAILEGRERGVVAVDLAGDEIGYPAGLFVEHFDKARDSGMRITVHAGEAASAGQVEQAITELGAERLGHAVRAVDDPAVMELIAERSIGIESCLTSNVQTGVVPTYSQHPLPVYLRRGMLVTLNTDSTVISGIDLAHEYRVVQDEIGLSESELAQLRENAFRISFLSEDERSELLSGLSDQGG